MGLWARLFSRSEQPERVAGEENILVISDIHLGEDVLTEGPEHLSEYIRALNRELAHFVAGHCDNHVDARPWHLVIDGDMFDFVKVSLKPTEEEAFQHWSRNLTDEELSQLPNTPENVVWKLGRILEIHRPLFRELARFVLHGNRVSIVEGNHDTEFYFPEVQSTLRDFIVSEAQKIARTERREPPETSALADAVQFPGWFIANPGRFHIEHGNQYDPYCSFEYNLVPLDRKDARTVATPMTHRVMPYFAEVLGDFSTHGIESWTGAQWAKYVFNLGPRMLWILTKLYFISMWEIMARVGRRREAELSGLAEQHAARLKDLAEQSPYGYETLEALDRLKATPAEYSFWKMLNVFFIDRFVVALATVGLIALGAVVGGAAGWSVAAAGLGSGALVLWGLSSGGGASVEERLRRAAAGIANETGARYVVFGHSHHAELVNLRERYGVGRFGERAFYLNSGSWVTREILLGEEGKGMTYVEITSRGAALKRWQGDEHSAVVLASTHGNVTTPLDATVTETRAAS